MRKSDQRYPECPDCIHFRPHRPSRICSRCDIGEFFQEKIDDAAPDEHQLMKIYSKMDRDDE